MTKTSSKSNTPGRRSAAVRAGAGTAPSTNIEPRRAPRSAPPNGKSAALIALLRNKRGASLKEMQKSSGWQAHSVRGFLSGTVKKRLGLKLNSSTTKYGERRYSVIAR